MHFPSQLLRNGGLEAARSVGLTRHQNQIRRHALMDDAILPPMAPTRLLDCVTFHSYNLTVFSSHHYSSVTTPAYLYALISGRATQLYSSSDFYNSWRSVLTSSQKSSEWLRRARPFFTQKP